VGTEASEGKPKGDRYAKIAGIGLMVVSGLLLYFIATRPAVPGVSAVIPAPAKSLEYLEAYAIDGVDYDALVRNTEAYVGKIIFFPGLVMQVIENGDAASLRFAINGHPNQTLMVNYPNYSKSRVLVGDEVIMYATVLGRVDYETVLGQQVTVPAVTADWVQISRPK
jgi:hypothetical protein